MMYVGRYVCMYVCVCVCVCMHAPWPAWATCRPRQRPSQIRLAKTWGAASERIFMPVAVFVFPSRVGQEHVCVVQTHLRRCGKWCCLVCSSYYTLLLLHAYCYYYYSAIITTRILVQHTRILVQHTLCYHYYTHIAIITTHTHCVIITTRILVKHTLYQHCGKWCCLVCGRVLLHRLESRGAFL